MKKLVMTLAAVATTMTATVADAAIYVFNLTGPQATATFQIDSSPTPSNVSQKGFFAVSPVVGVYNGVAGAATIDFFDTSNPEGSGGIEIDFPINGNAIYRGFGPVLFTGTLSAPTFKLGTFTLPGADANSKASTLTISALPGAVPEPATWAMMLMGFGMVGFGLRRRNTTARVSFARA